MKRDPGGGSVSSSWLDDAQNLHRMLMEAPAAIAILHGPELRYVFSNPLNQHYAGDRPLLGLTIRQAMPELEAEGVVAIAERVMATGQPFIAKELPILLAATPTRAERQAYLAGTYQPLHGPTGKVEGIMSFAFEVTEQVHARRRAELAEARLRVAVEAADLGTWDYDPESRQLECDARYRELFGLREGEPVDPDRLLQAIVADDRPRVYQAVEQAFDPQGGGEYRIQYRVIGVGDGVERFIEMRGRAFFDERGRPSRFTGTGQDVSAQRRRDERLRFLFEAGLTLATGLDYHKNVAQVAASAVPLLADWCVVYGLNDEGRIEREAEAHATAEAAEVAAEIARRYPPRPSHTRSLLTQVLESGQPAFVPELSLAQLEAVCVDREHFALVNRLGLRSVIIVPILVQGRPAGALSMVVADGRRRYDREDLAVAEELARRIAMAMESARLFQAVERAVQKRDDFLSIASHELKTPLASLALYLDACRRELDRGGLPDLDRMRSRLDRASTQVDRVTALVNRLLDVSRISAGRLQLDLVPGDLGELASDVVGRMREQAARAGCELRLRIEDRPGALELRCDPGRLEEVLTNLLGNAFKFGAGRPVEVEVHSHGGGLELVVSDGGPGIRPEDRERVFERFERTAEARNIGGIGLGLWISRQIVAAHGGTIRVAEGTLQGARFIVELPRDVPDPAPHPGG